MIDHPLVSVVMPTYNCAAYVGEALESVIKQDYPNIEVLVVDDGSSDETAAVVRRFGHPVRLIQQQNQGPAAARNRAIAAARGEYVAFLDGDDLWLPGKLSAQVAHLERQPDVDAVTTRFRRWYADANGQFSTQVAAPVGAGPFPLDPEDSGWLYPQLLLDSRIHIITALVRRRLFDRVGGFDEALRIGEDYDFWLRASRCTQIHRLAVETALYRIHGQSTTIVNWTRGNEYRVIVRAVQKFGLTGPDGRSVDKGALSRRLARLCFQRAYLDFWVGDPRQAVAGFRATLRHSPWHLRAAAYGMLAFLRCAAGSLKPSKTE